MDGSLRLGNLIGWDGNVEGRYGRTMLDERKKR